MRLTLWLTAGMFVPFVGPAPVKSVAYLYVFGNNGSDVSSFREVTCSELSCKPQPRSELPTSQLLDSPGLVCGLET